MVAIPDRPHSNKVISDGSKADRFVMGLLRACAAAVLVGAGTMRPRPAPVDRRAGATHRPPRPTRRYAVDSATRRDPEIAIVTTSGSIDLAHPVLEQGAPVLTTNHGAAALGSRLPGASQAIALPGHNAVDLRAAVGLLHERGHNLILSEGGRGCSAHCLSAELVDEMFLTISPLLAGRSSGARQSLIEGAELLPAHGSRSRLLGARSHHDHLFLRYGLRRSTDAP